MKTELAKIGKSCAVWLSAALPNNFGSPLPNAGEGAGMEGD